MPNPTSAVVGVPLPGESGAPPLCREGCGRCVARGVDKRGNPYKTCCRTCADTKGRSHHRSCVDSSIPAAPGDSGFDPVPGPPPAPPAPPRAPRHCQPCVPSTGAVAPAPTFSWCSERCGRKVAPGLTRSGKPFRTCCRGCAQGREHDESCMQPSNDVSALTPCSKGCGLPVSPGVDRKGQPFKTCCRGCAIIPGQHDDTCQRALNDEDFAKALAESDRKRLSSMRARRRRAAVRFHDAATCLWDPVWGGLELREINEPTPDAFVRRQRKQIMIAYTFALFPTMVVGFSCLFRRCLGEVKSGIEWSDVRRGWCRYLCSFAFLLSIPQLAYVMAPYFYDFGVSDYKRHDEFGAKNAAKMKYDDEWWRLVTPFLLHTGWAHVLGNLGIQLRAGITLEYLWGHFSWVIIYFGSGIFATLSSVALKPDSLSVGASGALSGLMGAWPVFLLATWDQVKDERERKKRDLILVIVLLSIAALIGFSFQPLIDWAAHFGGLAMGVFLAMTIFSWRITNRIIGIFVGSIGFVLSFLFYFLTVLYILEVIEPEPSLLDI